MLVIVWGSVQVAGLVMLSVSRFRLRPPLPSWSWQAVCGERIAHRLCSERTAPMTSQVMADPQQLRQTVSMQTALVEFGSALRWWRTTRRFSQLQLANEADVSTRHISFLETGKAQPSREMVVHLGIVLELPLRDRNALLYSAGFAPLYPHSDFDAPEMNEVRTVLRAILDAHSPNPAIVVDRRGDMIDSNSAAFMMIGAIVAVDSPALAPVPPTTSTPPSRGPGSRRHRPGRVGA